MANEEVKIVLSADDQASEKVKNATSEMKKMKQEATEAAFAFGAIGAAGVVLIKGWIDAANTAATNQAQLGAVIKSTGGAAGYTQEQINTLTDKIGGMTTASRATILATEEMLLTFTNIKGDNFEKATTAALDMATAMNGGVTPGADRLREQAIQLGKALNDPIKGMTALHRVGVAFTDAQKQQITVLQKSGDMAGAQAIILKELGTEFGGSALAATTTFSGAMQVLNNRYEEIQVTLGNALLPTLKIFGDYISKAMSWFEQLSPKMKEAVAQTTLFATAFSLVGAAVAGTIAIMTPTIAIVGAIVAVVTALFFAWKTNFLGIQDITTNVFTWIKEKAEAFWNFIGPGFKAMFAQVKILFDDVTGFIKAHWDTISSIFKVAMDYIKMEWNMFWDVIGTVLKVAWDLISGVITVGLNVMHGDFSGAWNAIKTMTLNIWTDMKDGVLSIWKDLWDGVHNMITDTTKKAAEWGADFMKNMVMGITNSIPFLNQTIDGITAVFNKLHQSYNPLIPAELWGNHFVQNLSNGVHTGMPLISDALTAIEVKFNGFKTKIKQITDTTAETAQLKMLNDQLKSIAQGGQNAVDAKQKEMNDLQKQFAKEDHDAQMKSLQDQLAAATTVADKKSIQDQIDAMNLQDQRQAQLDAVQAQIDGIESTTKAAEDAAQAQIDAVQNVITQKEELQKQMLAALDQMQKVANDKATFDYQVMQLKEQEMHATTQKDKKKLEDEMEKLISENRLKMVQDSEQSAELASKTTYDKERDYIQQLIAQYAQLAAAKAAAFSAQSSAVSGHRAMGGPVTAGESYVVGEIGQEIFTPSTSGTIIPNNKIGGGGSTQTIVFNFNGPVSSKDVAKQYADEFFRSFKSSSQSF